MSSNLKNKKFIFVGFLASLSLLFIYFGILSIANSFSHAVEQFSQMWYWILLLVAGFGLQAGLYFFIREKLRQKQERGSTVAIAASGGISTGSMIACCLHHLVDVLPLMGLAAAAVFLIQYQLLFIIVGVLSNLIGITIMLEIIQKNGLAKGFLDRILIFDMNRVKRTTIGLSLILFLTILLVTNNSINKSEEVNIIPESQPETSEKISLPSRIDSQDEVSFEVTPLDFTFNNPVRFEIKIDTHSGSLDFDLTEISILKDEKGNRHQVLNWQGSLPGGHHRSGVLSFHKVNNQTKKLTLIIKDDLQRVFEWDL